MAAKALDPLIAADIVKDWRIGKLSIRDLAEKHNVSRGKVGELCKGVEKDCAVIVDAGIQYKQALHAHDGRMVDAIEKEVDKAVQRREWLDQAALQNVKSSMTAPCITQQDHRHRSETIGKAKEVVFGKAPENAIQINNNAVPPAAPLTVSPVEIREILEQINARI